MVDSGWFFSGSFSDTSAVTALFSGGGTVEETERRRRMKWMREKVRGMECRIITLTHPKDVEQFVFSEEVVKLPGNF